MSSEVHLDESRIVEALRASPRGPLKPKELARDLRVPNARYRAFRRMLAEMERGGRLRRVRGGRYAVPQRRDLLTGRLSVVRSGDGFVTPEGGGRDVYVAAADLASALDGDQVVVRVESRPRRRNPEGRVMKVVERVHESMVGVFRRLRRAARVDPRARALTRPVFIPPGDDGGARDGDLVVVEILDYGGPGTGPAGRVRQVLGPSGDSEAEILSIVVGHGLPLEFEPAVLAEAEKARETPMDLEPGRNDRRALHLFTIDPEDARDHDDALSVTEAGKGLWEVGVHIADVSRYVTRGSALDAEAIARGNSTYLVDRVIPMLPPALSSDVCSLLPDADRLAVSVFAVLDEQGRLRRYRFERTLVRSRHRLAYPRVQQVLDGDSLGDPETDDALRTLDRLARALRTARSERGSLDFDVPEARVLLSSDGEPLDVRRAPRFDSHRLVEDFMLLANQVVASELSERRLPAIYRVHEPPTRIKLAALREFLATLGYTLPRGDVGPRDLQQALDRSKGRPEEALVSTVTLRAMQRARYSASNLGHYGLAAPSYGHFTSPIRRYPDLVTHRVVIRALIEGRSPPESWSLDLDTIAARSSEREQISASAERESVDLKKVEFMEQHLGDTFEGTVSGVVGFGFFVLLDAFYVEGLVHVSGLDDDYYEFREREHALVGRRRGRRFRIGDRVRVQVARLMKDVRQIDFALVGTL